MKRIKRKKTKILWLSRHEPLEVQIMALKWIFGENVEVFQDSKRFSGVREIMERFANGSFHEMVLVAPLSIISKLTERGIKPLCSIMKRVNSPDEADIEKLGSFYRFVCFRRISGVKVDFEPLIPIRTHKKLKSKNVE